MRNVFRSTGLLLALATVYTATPGGVWAEELPPGPNFTVQSTFDGQAVDGPYEIVHIVLDFGPGAWTPSHTHGGQVFVTVLSGAMTVRDDTGSEEVFTAGDTWREMPGDHHMAGNATGETARVLATFLLPEGVSLTTVADTGDTELPPGPVPVYQTRTAGPAISGALDVVQLEADFAAGAWTPQHEHGGRGVVTVIAGAMQVRDASGVKTYDTGESWIEGEGEVAAVGNDTERSARLVASFVLPKGATLTTVHEPTTEVSASLPVTGGSGWLPGLAVLMGSAALGIGLLLRRRTAVTLR